jgi:membrane protein
MFMWRTIRRVVDRWNHDDAGLLAAAVAYYAALSLFPLMLILTSGLGVFLKWTNTGQDARQYVLAAIGEQLSPVLEQNVRQALEQVQQNAGLGGPIGALTLLITALAIFAQFERAFDRIWNVEPSVSKNVWNAARNLLTHRLRAFGMLAGLGLAIVAVFLAGMAFTAFKNLAPPKLSGIAWLWWFAETFLAITLNALVFTLLYRLLPKVSVPWDKALRGGLVAAAIWEIGRQLLAAFVIGQRYTSAYGVIGSLLAIMLWGYYSIAVVFVGAEYIQVLSAPAPVDVAKPTRPAYVNRRTIQFACDGLFALALLYVGVFLGARHMRTYEDSRMPAGDPRHNVVVFSRNPETQQVARMFFSPLMFLVPGRYHYPDRDEMRLLSRDGFPEFANSEL